MSICANEVEKPTSFTFYKISCREKDNNSCYIGKTTNLNIRYSTHKSNAKYSKLKLYEYIREHGGFDNFKIDVVHHCICDEKTSTMLELYFINEYKNKGFQMLNTNYPNILEKQEYNKIKCQEHYCINVTCECGWIGSKMNYCKHLKNSLKHKNYCLKKIEKEIDSQLLDITPLIIVLDGLESPQFITM
jgi:hypothetical protein